MESKTKSIAHKDGGRTYVIHLTHPPNNVRAQDDGSREISSSYEQPSLITPTNPEITSTNVFVNPVYERPTVKLLTS